MQFETKSEIFFVIIIGTVMVLLLAAFIISFLFLYQRRNFRHRVEKEQIKNSFQKELLKAQLEIREQTLKNVSQEIHDNIGQVLSLVKLHLTRIDPQKIESSGEKINDSKDLVAKAIQDLRSISKSLDTDAVMSVGLFNAVKNELDIVQRAGFHQTHLVLEGSLYKLESHAELILFRILQETLNNIIKHAKAKKITVNFNYEPLQLTLKITDDGIGFDLNQLNQSDKTEFGLGLKNMHNRARIIDADFSMESTFGAGTVVIIKMPNKIPEKA
ncbi:MAG: sensor histidine kinase [Sphingobacteriales bacterium]|nr:sensor histidine kinase [Sphingobacteriales bacterium]MBI3720583.1 sensor histidine kinase [Sphingobacteriales bacterium]